MNLAEKGHEMLLELKRSKTIPPYNTASMEAVIKEINEQADSLQFIHQQANREELQDPSVRSNLLVRAHIINRNKRCGLAYLNNRFERLRDLWWSTGRTLPAEIKASLSANELITYEGYDSLMSTYMNRVGVALTIDQQPPKDVLIEVEALEDCGEIMTEMGAVLLRKDTRHLMRRTDCELLIKQGLMRQINSSWGN